MLYENIKHAELIIGGVIWFHNCSRTHKKKLQWKIAALRKINDSEMRAPAGILHFAAQQAGTCQGMQGRQWERDAWTCNEERRREFFFSLGFGEESNHLVFHFHFICEVWIHKWNYVKKHWGKNALNSTASKCFDAWALVYIIKQANTLAFSKSFWRRFCCEWVTGFENVNQPLGLRPKKKFQREFLH